MKSPRGFTLIEVLVAAAILGITATALFGLFSKSLFNLRKVEDLHRYELAAQDVMNRVRQIPDLLTLEIRERLQGRIVLYDNRRALARLIRDDNDRLVLGSRDDRDPRR